MYIYIYEYLLMCRTVGLWSLVLCIEEIRSRQDTCAAFKKAKNLVPSVIGYQDMAKLAKFSALSVKLHSHWEVSELKIMIEGFHLIFWAIIKTTFWNSPGAEAAGLVPDNHGQEENKSATEIVHFRIRSNITLYHLLVETRNFTIIPYFDS